MRWLDFEKLEAVANLLPHIGEHEDRFTSQYGAVGLSRAIMCADGVDWGRGVEVCDPSCAAQRFIVDCAQAQSARVWGVAARRGTWCQALGTWPCSPS